MGWFAPIDTDGISVTLPSVMALARNRKSSRRNQYPRRQSKRRQLPNYAASYPGILSKMEGFSPQERPMNDTNLMTKKKLN
jgi:hypothetical protein